MNNIAITLGDPGGIGPEIIVKAISGGEISQNCNPLVIGSAKIIKEAVRLTNSSFEVINISGPADSSPSKGKIEVIDINSGEAFIKGFSSAEGGRAAVRSIKKAVELALKNEVSAIVTAPISKESLRMAGYKWPGHTELLAELTGVDDFAMMFVSEKLKIVLCTIHIPLRDVPDTINKDLVYRAIRHAVKAASILGIYKPVIGVAGLNPHAGESGLFGNEERDAIIPAIEDASADDMYVSGPYPPDVIFHKAYNGDFDIVVCMYHDQGLIPFKMLAFDTGINVTLGLPFIRTSPDHGTAFDIAWQNKANPSSMIEAIKLASKIDLKIDR
ncbi:MAG: 4-hydroxythreonine-4-phosphate dehydrogenase PdxA [Thermodesulfovibrionia bacterium]|nr:4-hydroxythreonine-4-phosphate dehydrogenase PdxA [Thermodesulfovibrionia bacterium]